MGLHMVALAKLKLLSSASHGISPAILAGLVCPFVVKFSFSCRLIRKAYIDVLYTSRLFVFQLGRIAFESEPASAALANGNNIGNNSRWERAIRLICQRATYARRSPPPTESDEDIFHTLTVLSL